jgi:hypothetical protein
MARTERLFVIHAGTHKTASSYIQSRMQVNAEKLQAMGVHTSYPADRKRKFKPLASALRQEKWRLWRQYLKSIPAEADNVLVSAEQFAKPLADPKTIDQLIDLLAEFGFRMQVVAFVRDQPDYINARYVHSTRRLYHHLSFKDYVRRQLIDGSMIFDYSLLFSSLLANSRLQTCFLPFGSRHGDPFERLMAAQGWPSQDAWKSAKSTKANVQPGCKGVWLAREVKKWLDEHGEKPARPGQLSKEIRRISEKNEWTNNRFFGFNEELQAEVIQHYAASNNNFARRVWGQSWHEVFPLKPAQRMVYDLPDAGQEREHMLAYVEKVLRLLPDATRDST